MKEKLNQLEIKKLKTVNLSDEITNQLIQQIVQGKLKGGEKLPSERELTEMFGVSRSSVREAINAISRLGLIKIVHGKGSFVNEGVEGSADLLLYPLLSFREDMKSLFEARMVVQVKLAEFAAVRAKEEDIRNIEKRIEAMKNAKSMEEMVQADVDYDFAIAKSAKNPVLLTFLSSIQTLMKMTQSNLINPQAYSNAIFAHSLILEKIRSRDSFLAGEEMKKHLLDVMRVYHLD
ncbi:FadR/GntR family transcriptional regulator [Desulfitobacterium sp. AusDCA]|uniref:FadR/GntR family transcriptional regulator n=1 Tax=Desulfitobacterium sp. AusDCA TaxID=3240383 RepID=UPI003DA7971E